jgi:hypothetical protein
VAHALACAARRVAAHDDERAVLVHGDVHVVERVSTGLLATRIGLQPVGRQMLAAADHVAD